MPKDNEVDEKVEDFFERLYGMTFRLFLDPNSEEDEGNTVELRLGATVGNLALFETQDHAVLHTAATVAELRADRDSWREQAEDRLREWDKLRAEVERLHFELDMLRGNYEQQTAYTIIHKGVLRYCNSSMRDAYSDETARADAAERRVAALQECAVRYLKWLRVSKPEAALEHDLHDAGMCGDKTLTGADPT